MEEDTNVLKFSSKMRMETLFNGAVEQFGIVEGAAAPLPGCDDPPDFRCLLYRDLELCVVPDEDGHVDHCFAISRVNNTTSKVLEEHFSDMKKAIEKTYETALVFPAEPEFDSFADFQAAITLEQCVAHDLENGFWYDVLGFLKPGPYRRTLNDFDSTDTEARIRHLKLRIAQWIVASDPTLLDRNRKQECLTQIHEAWREFCFHFLSD